MSKEFYYINGAYSPQTYAVIYGTLVKGYDGEGDSPDFWLTTPSIDLQWGEGCGEAMDEKKEVTILPLIHEWQHCQLELSSVIAILALHMFIVNG